MLALDGVIISVIASQARETFVHASALGSVGQWFAAGSLARRRGLVLISIGLALGAIRKAKSKRWSSAEIEDMPSKATIRRSKLETQRIFLKGLCNRAVREATAYQESSRLLNRAFGVLVVAVIAIAVYVGVFAVRTVEQKSCSAASRSTSMLIAEEEDDVPEPRQEDCQVSLQGGPGEAGDLA